MKNNTIIKKDYYREGFWNRRGGSKVSFFVYNDGCTVVIENKKKAYYYAFSLSKEEAAFYKKTYARCENGCSVFALFRFLGRMRRPFKREVIPVA